jgi:hypothetical protein
MPLGVVELIESDGLHAVPALPPLFPRQLDFQYLLLSDLTL